MPNLEKYERTKLMQGANAFHARVSRKGREMLEMAREAGERLNTLKADTPHGQWLGYLESTFEGSRQSAATYMRVAQNWSEIEVKCKGSLHLGIHEAIRLLRPPTDDAPSHEEPKPPITDIQTPESPSPAAVSSMPASEPGAAKSDAPGGSPALRTRTIITDEQTVVDVYPTTHVQKPESQSNAGPAVNAGSGAGGSPVVSGTATRQSPGGRRASAAKSNSDAELIAHIVSLKKNLLLLLGYLPNKEYYLKEKQVFVSETQDDLTRTLDTYIRALRNRSDVRINPPTLEQCKALAAELSFNDEDALDYFEARDRSGWHYGTPAVNPVRDVRRDMPAYLRLRRRGEAENEARYQTAKQERQAEARGTDLMTATVAYMTEEEYNALQNGKTP